MGLRDKGRYFVPSQLVKTETVIRDPAGRFSFEIPWPWFERHNESGQHPPPEVGTIVLLAPRTRDPWPEASIWSAGQAYNLDDGMLKSESRRLARALGGKAGRARRLLVDGAPAAALFVECGDTVTHQITIASQDAGVMAVFRLPRGEAPGYEVHVETMLATWAWS